MIRVVIADDHPVVRRGLREILSEDPGITVVGEASGTAELFERVRAQPCDVALVDVSMPGRGGIEALGDLRQEFPRLAILVLSAHSEEQYAVRALRSGAAGYLTKAAAVEELVTAIKRVAQGRRYVTDTLAERLASLVETGDGPPHQSLSDREHQVMVLLGRAKTVGEIADEIALSVKTVSTYRARVLKKLGLKHNADVMRYVLDHGLRE